VVKPIVNKPELIVVGGANGSGKTTFALEYAHHAQIPYLGADELARQIAPDNLAAAQLEAGRQFFDILERVIDQRQSIIVETTLSGRGFQNWMRLAQNSGYSITLFYLYVDSPELCILRVSERVRKGGHHVPASDIRRRFNRSLTNFWNIYRQMADNWVLVYNEESSFVDVAIGSKAMSSVRSQKLFQQFLQQVERG
jgi:predicted ABC-type ATPase